MSHHPRTEGETDIKLMKLKIDYNLYTKGEPDPVTPGCKGRSDSLKKEKKKGPVQSAWWEDSGLFHHRGQMSGEWRLMSVGLALCPVGMVG